MGQRGGIVVIRKNIPASIRRDHYHTLLMVPGKHWPDMVVVQQNGTRIVDYAEFDKMV